MKKNSWKIKGTGTDSGDSLLAVRLFGSQRNIGNGSRDTGGDARAVLKYRDGGRNAAGSRAGGTLRKRREDTELSDRGMDGCRKGDRRPLAIMMSNDKAALPQYGINHAGVVYEAPVEGSMNRYMALIEDYDDLDRIGSVRSCRPILLFAKEFEAVYAHYGQNTFTSRIWSQMEHLDGIKGNGYLRIFGPGSEDPAQCLCIRTKAAPGDRRAAVMRMRTGGL